VAVRLSELCEQPLAERVGELGPWLDRTIERLQEDGEGIVIAHCNSSR
jgi:hypothetical protein